jgi:hypothetical protein
VSDHILDFFSDLDKALDESVGCFDPRPARPRIFAQWPEFPRLISSDTGFKCSKSEGVKGRRRRRAEPLVSSALFANRVCR